MFEKTYQELLAGQYEGWGRDAYPRRASGWKTRIDALIHLDLLPPPPAAVLELGCGNGMASLVLARRGYRVSGIDISSTAIEWATTRFGAEGLAGSFRVGDIRERLPYGDGEFTVVVDGDCLHCIVDGSRSTSFAEAYRVTRPGGFFLLSSMCGPPRSTSARRAYDRCSRCLVEDGRPYRYMPRPWRLRREVLRAGFDVRRAHVKRNPWWGHLTLWAQRPDDSACALGDGRAGPR